jgi:hypothetical protein
MQAAIACVEGISPAVGRRDGEIPRDAFRLGGVQAEVRVSDLTSTKEDQ